MGERRRGLLVKLANETYVLVQGKFVHGDQGVVRMGPDLGHVEDVPAIGFGVHGVHNLEVHCLRGTIPLGDGIVKIGSVIVWLFTSKFDRFFLGEVFDALVGLDVDLDIVDSAVLQRISAPFSAKLRR